MSATQDPETQELFEAQLAAKEVAQSSIMNCLQIRNDYTGRSSPKAIYEEVIQRIDEQLETIEIPEPFRIYVAALESVDLSNEKDQLLGVLWLRARHTFEAGNNQV